MDSREHINKTADDEAFAPADEAGMTALLKEALADACPDPGGRIAAAVMAQIRGEQEAEAAARRAERADARRRRQGLFMKWGGMAACMMILCGALVVASPLMNRGDMAVQQAADQDAGITAPAETVPELLTADAVTEAYSDEAVDGEANTYTYTTTEEAVLTKSAPVKQSYAVEAEEAADAAPAEAVMYAARPMADAAEETCDPETENQLYLDALLESGRLAEAVYLAWMAENGYTAVTDWTIEELNAAFGFGE
ncbi:MAG: hypothetical protein IKY52_01380 [Clostridia bacterium]|nr:hypothetical protein [Clostridia bacterium]